MRLKQLCTLFLLVMSTNIYANCQTTHHRAFDFWLGHWQVTTENDNIVRYNKITVVNQGCTLLEEYHTPSGYLGKSLNIYDPVSQKWHQTWTDSQGTLLLLSGNLVGKAMILEGKGVNESLNRITWTPHDNGSVRQHWQVSKDKGVTWNTVFDGLYTKR